MTPIPAHAYTDELSEAGTSTILNVAYHHVALEGEGVLYLTQYGLPYLEVLRPQHWWRNKWERLSGTSTASKVAATSADGQQLDLVVKFSRVGTTLELDATRLLDPHFDWEFNSPFEEFALVFALRAMLEDELDPVVQTHIPLGIYVPAYAIDPLQEGRKPAMFHRKHRALQIELDIHRDYLTLYQWVDGIDAAQATAQRLLPATELQRLVAQSRQQLDRLGFTVGDHKPEHLILHLDAAGQLRPGADGQLPYTLIDFELLRRNSQRQDQLRSQTRTDYHIRQAQRFQRHATQPMPPGLAAMTIFGVDYIYGQVPSTGGALWVVGHDPALFDYFTPERWRKTPRTQLSGSSEIYRTTSKDNIHLVWRVSRVGEPVELAPDNEAALNIIAQGYNSPFEAVALAMSLNQHGASTTYPRAIYMTGEEHEHGPVPRDDRRFLSHQYLRTPAGEPILRPDRAYIEIWGYWNGPDELIARDGAHRYTPCSALAAYQRGAFNDATCRQLLHDYQRRLQAAGVADPDLRTHHLLVSFDHDDRLVRDPNGLPEVRLCNFELLHWQ